MADIVPDKDPLDALTSRERTALTYFVEKKEPLLAPSLQAQLFALFLNGKTTEEIRKMNPGLSLGAIVQARIAGKWDEQREAHLQNLFQGVRERAQQAQLEGVTFISDLMAATHKLHGDRVIRFLQTGNPADLGDMRIDSLEGYRKVVEILLKLTGQDSQKKVSGTVEHRVTAGPVPGAARPLSSSEAASILKSIDTGSK